MNAMFSDNKSNSEETVILKLSKSIYGLFQASRSWYQHLQKGLESLEFDPSDSDKVMYYGKEMIAITHVDDCFFFGPNIKEIQKVIKEPEEN